MPLSISLLLAALGLLAAPPATGWKSSEIPAATLVALASEPDGPRLYALDGGGAVHRTADGGASWSAVDTGIDQAVAIAVDPRAPSTLFVAGSSVATSADAGGTWTDIGDALPERRIPALAFDPRSGALWAATEEGVWKTTDRGKSWAQASGPSLADAEVRSLALDTASGTLFAGTRGGDLYRTTDGGASWQAIGGEVVDCREIRTLLFEARTHTLHAAGSCGAFRSGDAGTSWTVDSGLPDPSYVDAMIVAPGSPGSPGAPSAPSTLYAAASLGIFRSLDDGAHWTVDAGLGQVSALAIDPRHPGGLFAASLRGLYATSAADASWRRAGWSPLAVAVLTVDPAQRGHLYASSFEGLFESRDAGGCWTRVHGGLPAGLPGPNMMAEAIAVDPSHRGTVYLADTVDGLFATSDAGESWRNLVPELRPPGPLLRITFDPSAPGRIYASADKHGVYVSDDLGATWQDRSEGLPTFTDVGALVVAPGEPRLLYAGTSGHGLFASADAGASWRPVTAGLPDGATNVVALAADPRQPAPVYAALNTDDGALGVFRSVDRGLHWRPASGGLPTAATTHGITAHAPANARGGSHWVARDVTPAAFSDLVIAADSPSHLYLGTLAHGVFESRDGGEHWAAANAGLGDLEVLALAADPHDAGSLFAGTTSGIFRTRDGGRSWARGDRGLADVYPRVVAAGATPADCPGSAPRPPSD
jgi:photosystem II stability/assembly factor-like uncharacterized protein